MVVSMLWSNDLDPDLHSMASTMAKPADFWNERYQRDDYLFGTEANDFIRAMAPFPPRG